MCAFLFSFALHVYVESYLRWKKLRERAEATISGSSSSEKRARHEYMQALHCCCCFFFLCSPICSAFLFSFCPVVVFQFNTCDFVHRTHCFSFSWSLLVCFFLYFAFFLCPRAHNNKGKNTEWAREKEEEHNVVVVVADDDDDACLVRCVCPSEHTTTTTTYKNVRHKCFISIHEPKTLKRYIRTSTTIDWAILFTGQRRVAVVPRLIIKKIHRTEQNTVSPQNRRHNFFLISRRLRNWVTQKTFLEEKNKVFICATVYTRF